MPMTFLTAARNSKKYVRFRTTFYRGVRFFLAAGVGLGLCWKWAVLVPEGVLRGLAR